MDVKAHLPVSWFPVCTVLRRRKNCCVSNARSIGGGVATIMPRRAFQRAQSRTCCRRFNTKLRTAPQVYSAMSVEENTFLPSLYEMGAAPWPELNEASAELLNQPLDLDNLAVRVSAAKALDEETAWQIVDDPGWLDACALIRGDIGQGQQVVDLHVRLVVDCLLRGDVSATRTLYETLSQGPPLIAKEKVAMHAAVGSFTYQFIQEEQAIFCSVLGDLDEVTPEAQMQLDSANAICDAIDLVAAVMPAE